MSRCDCSFGSTARLWEADTGQELLTLKGHHNVVRSVAFSSDGRRIVTGSYDQTAKVWEAPGSEQVAAWQQVDRAAAQALAARLRERTAEGAQKNPVTGIEPELAPKAKSPL